MQSTSEGFGGTTAESAAGGSAVSASGNGDPSLAEDKGMALGAEKLAQGLPPSSTERLAGPANLDYMDTAYLHQVVRALEDHGVIFERGLSDLEVGMVEELYSITFPPDLRALLQTALPSRLKVDGGIHILLFPNWRKGPKPTLRKWLRLPRNEILFAVEHCEYWHPGWGAKPEDAAEALQVARKALRLSPPLIPVFGHNYLVADPPIAGNPVVSVVHSSVAHEGADLARFLHREFGAPLPAWAAEHARPVPVWGDLVAA